ncbi:MAG TPA: RHS repeat-associated core domain-containing protein [bacterium]|nr:RHS repeat-associated core domain-containing protein [bacterium]
MREYVNDANGVVCTIDYDYRGWGGYELGWHLKDHLGSTVAVVAQPVLSVPPEVPLKPGQRILWTGSYESFGRPDSNVPVCPGAWENPIQFTGYYSDGDVFEHYYAQARYYDPYTGRFLSRDPADFEYDKSPIAINRYPYAGNNPIRFVDPNGKFFWSWFLGLNPLSIFLDAMTGMVIGGVASLFNENIDFGEGLMSGFLAGLVTGATNQIMLLTGGFSSSLFSLQEFSWNSFSNYSSIIMNSLQNCNLTMRNPSFSGLEGALPMFIHHGIAGLGLSAAGNVFGMFANTANPGWGAFWTGFQISFDVVGFALQYDDFTQHFFQLYEPKYESPIHKLGE